MNALLRNLILFILFGCFYVTIEVFYRGFSHPLMFVVAGLSTLIIDRFNDRISWDIPIWLQAFWGTIVILALELASGYFGLIVLHTRIWDYSHLPLSFFDGLICLPFAAIWYLLTFAIIILADVVNYYFLNVPERPYYVLWKSGKKYWLPEK